MADLYRPMLTSLLVLFVCTQDTGCSTASTAYLASHPEMRQIVKRNELRAKELLGPNIVAIAPGILFLGTGKGTFNLTKYLSIQVSKDTEVLRLQFSF